MKENSKNNKPFIIFFLIIFIIMTLYYVILSKTIADYRPMKGDRIVFNSFLVSFNNLLTNSKQIKVYLYLELITSLILGYLLYTKIATPNKFQSGIVEITPAIKIPAPAGQGQFGNAWFLDDIYKTTLKKPTFFEKIMKKKKKEIFKHNEIDLNNINIQKLIKKGNEDIKDKIEELNNGVSIIDIEKEIKKEQKNKTLNEQDEKDSEYFKNNFENNDLNNFDDFLENDKEVEDNINLIINTNNSIDFNDFEENIELTKEILINKYTESIKTQNEEELKKEKPYNPLEDKFKFFNSGGLITGIYNNEESNKEYVYYVDSDTHSVIIGATRSGKSRCLVMQSIGNLALAGESIVVTDPKGELYAYTSKFMKELGYEVICLDFKNAKFSSKYNLLQPIINAKNERTEEHPNGDIETIVKFSEELANMLIKETKGENPMWTDNAKTMITGAILSLVLENDDESVMNMANVYRFINSGEGKDICQTKDNLYLYIKALQIIKPESPIINSMLGIINTPPETRGGFSTNASSATRLFTQPSIWEITHTSNVDLAKMGSRKQILYFILPDQDTSYYKIVSIIVKQMYNELVKVSDRYGGRLPIRVNFLLDEFGNFAPISDLGTILTVAGGRGMRFNLFLQGFPQITQKYDKETTEIVKSNCETWVYLKAMDTATLDEISKKLGSYTIYSNSESMNIQNNMATSQSSSQSLQKRNLLLPEEIQKLNRPYLLVMYGNNKPAITNAPDISNLTFNSFYGMGNEEYNNQLRMIRDRQRVKTSEEEEIKYWGIYDELKNVCNVDYSYNQDEEGMDENECIKEIVQYLKYKEYQIKGEI